MVAVMIYILSFFDFYRLYRLFLGFAAYAFTNFSKLSKVLLRFSAYVSSYLVGRKRENQEMEPTQKLKR